MLVLSLGLGYQSQIFIKKPVSDWAMKMAEL
jgi:hypothetical protein